MFWHFGKELVGPDTKLEGGGSRNFRNFTKNHTLCLTLMQPCWVQKIHAHSGFGVFSYPRELSFLINDGRNKAMASFSVSTYNTHIAE